MELKVLQYFILVSREESITGAARILNISQPTLSRQLIQLEEELGVKLFKRGRHSVSRTEEGLLFRRRAQEILNIAGAAKKEILKSSSLSGTISIASSCSCNMHELAHIMSDFKKKILL